MPESPHLKVVLDTNVFVSGLMGVCSPPRLIIDAWLDDRFTLVTSLYLVTELNHVLSYPRIADRLQVSSTQTEQILAALLSQTIVVPGKVSILGVTRDPKDDAVVACAVEGKADCIVSGDQDLLVLGTYQGIQVVTPAQFAEQLG
jgi:hypothetical protein